MVARVYLESWIYVVARLHVEPWLHVVAQSDVGVGVYLEPRLHVEQNLAVVGWRDGQFDFSYEVGVCRLAYLQRVTVQASRNETTSQMLARSMGVGGTRWQKIPASSSSVCTTNW